MLKLLRDTGGIYVAVICDHCEKRITRCSEGTGIYAEEGDGAIMNDRLFFVHDECSDAFTHHPRWDGGTWYLLPLTIIPTFLGLNIGLTPELSAASLEYWVGHGYMTKKAAG